MKNTNEKLIYLDNAATSFPKPPAVAKAMNDFMQNVGANPGRSGHRLSIEASRNIFDAREALAGLFGVKDPDRVVFCSNATEALNLVLKGLLKPGDHVVASAMEHNSVIRPLRALERNGTELTIAECAANGVVAPEDVTKSFRKNTKAVVMNHVSNVTGGIMPIAAVGRECRERGIYFIVDCAQSAGCVDIDMNEDLIDFAAFTGHKALFGPQGTGGLVLNDEIDFKILSPLKQGGSGSSSESETHPVFLPDVFEAGTPNTVGIAGLNAGVRFVLDKTVRSIREEERLLMRELMNGLMELKGIGVPGGDEIDRSAAVSFVAHGRDAAEISFRLDDEYGIMCRAGLHCAPVAHKTLGTFPGGAVRFSLSVFNTMSEIREAVDALKTILTE